MCKTYYILQNDLSLLAFQLPSVLELHFHYVIIYLIKLYITILLVASVYICHFYLWCTSTYFFLYSAISYLYHYLVFLCCCKIISNLESTKS